MIRHALLAAAFSLGIQPAFAGGVGQQGIVGSAPVKVGPGGAAGYSDGRLTTHVASNAALRAALVPASGSIVRDGFYAVGDGGAATYVYSTQTCSAPDDGAQVTPAGGGCWIADLSGRTPDVRLWGAVDIGLGSATGADSTGALNAAMTWCGATKGNSVVNIGPIRVAALSGNVVIPNGCTLHFIAHSGWRNDGSGYQYTVANTSSVLLLSSSYTVSLSGVLENAAIFAAGLTPATSAADANRKVAAFAGTAVTFAAPDAKLVNPFLVGFATCVSDNGFERPWINNSQVDCTNGFYFNNLQDVSHVTGLHGYAYYLNDIDGTPYANIIQNVSGAANNGSGLIRLTLDGTSQFATGMTLLVRGVQGLTAANGIWTVTVVDGTHVDLQGTNIFGASPTGTWASGETAVTVSSLTGVAYGQSVSGTGIAGGTTVRSIDWRKNVVWLSAPTNSAGSSTSLSFSNGAYTGSGGQVIADALRRTGTFISVNGGFQQNFTDTFEYGWKVGYHVTGVTWATFTNASCDAFYDPASVCMWWDGATTLTSWNGGTAGGTGATLFDDTTSAAATNSAVGINVRVNIGTDAPWVTMSLAGAGSRQLMGLYTPNGGVVSSIVQYASAGTTLLTGNMPYLDLYPQNGSAMARVNLGPSAIFAAGSPYSYQNAMSWSPALTFNGSSTGINQSNYGIANIAWPWESVKYNVNLSAIPTQAGKTATIIGLPFSCEGALSLSGEGAPMAFTSGMVSLTGPVGAMPGGNSSALYLEQSSATGSSGLTDNNFTATSAINGNARCKMPFTQR